LFARSSAFFSKCGRGVSRLVDDFLCQHESWRKACFAASALCLLSALLLVIGPQHLGRSDASEAPIRIRMAGQDLAPGPEGTERALEIVRRYALGTVSLGTGASPDRLVIPRALIGAAIDRVRLSSLLAQARDPESAMRKEAHGGVIDLPIPLVVEGPLALRAVLSYKDDVDRPPMDARFDLDARRLVPEQPGVRLEVYGTLAALDRAFAAGAPEVNAEVVTKAPRLVREQLGGVSFSEVIGWFSTRYATDEKHQARTFNLRLAASKLDGHVILPGETFDFNEVVGPRDETHGYKVAPVIAEGELVDGIGGGTCQVAGTLHGAALFAGLDIVERHPHTRPSFYIKMGLDATVAYPTITLRLKNPFDHPVVLHEVVKEGEVRAEILGPKRTRTVTFVRKIDEVVPFPEVERKDPSLPRGTTVVAQRGIPGFSIHRYRVVREGPFAVREKVSDSYPPTTQIVRVGTGQAKASAVVREDEHPEYVADDYLVLLQGPEVKSTGRSTSSEPGGGMVELRVAGRTGEHGWTARQMGAAAARLR
jgi:vancomycin resistance protein YoaR